MRKHVQPLVPREEEDDVPQDETCCSWTRRTLDNIGGLLCRFPNYFRYSPFTNSVTVTAWEIIATIVSFIVLVLWTDRYQKNLVTPGESPWGVIVCFALEVSACVIVPICASDGKTPEQQPPTITRGSWLIFKSWFCVVFSIVAWALYGTFHLTFLIILLLIESVCLIGILILIATWMFDIFRATK
jgi:hypothetical protein